MTRKKEKTGFTLLELMITVAIIGLLATMAMPAFVRARVLSQQNTCVNNLRIIEGGKERYTIDKGSAPLMPDLIDTYIKRTPECPGGGTYGLGIIDLSPTCNIVGHAL